MIKKEKIVIYYDEDCPLCKNYVNYLKLKDNYELILKNVREDNNDTKIDINNGFIVSYNNKFYQGSQALEFLNSIVNKSTILGKLHFFFKYDNIFSKILYKTLFLLRKISLLLIGKKSKI
ncbi:DCC1-like thiol-disulfide oxidoreductase family protein [Aliarcobacter lanthieri]|uniref:DCC1-like thiol-disulfide oxidoreductase family protein n=1 Tax=Aliarcobacter lanthieri TaxID=1355374 RepID=UPI0004A6B5F1|nr:DCC1-like thiol-disulfide oxidoreductase family protein [Aliarcobacter lanthieri]QKF59312.1 hypothetical protein ALANTH_1204 [Aliarcobacter lanthieri]